MNNEYEIGDSMNYDDIKRRVEEYYRTIEDINKLNLQIKEIYQLKEETINNIKVSTISEVPKNNNIKDSTFDTIQKIIDEYDKEINKLGEKIIYRINNKNIIEQILSNLTREERAIIKLNFYNKLSQKEMASELIKRKIYYQDTSLSKKKKDILSKMIIVFNKQVER